ncbi:MAG: CotH kinase family protein [Erysipelotrichaceae bacterium]|nr:CotH kinase family protein [Erysipelotrichaceae bacterium]
MRIKRITNCILFVLLLVAFGCQTKVYEPEAVSFSVESGAYPDAVTLRLSAPEGYTIRYTTDSSVPNKGSKRYSKELYLSGSGEGWLNDETIDLIHVDGVYDLKEAPELADAWIIRAAAFAPDGTMGPVSTKTYFPNRSIFADYNGTMLISVVTDPENLLDYEKGILAKGIIFDQWRSESDSEKILNDSLWWKMEANYSQKGKAWERPAEIEIFDSNDHLSIEQSGGIRVHGGVSRMYSHKSFRVYFREEYGKEEIEYSLFPDDSVNSYQCFVLRNGGNLADGLIFKDGWQQALLSERSFLTQHSRPVVLYLNGEYWGIYNLNDRFSSQYLEKHFGISDVLIVKDGEFEDGDADAIGLYDELNAFENEDMSDPKVWERFKRIVDIQSMADYFAAEIYMGNYDFTSIKNYELWCSMSVEPGNPYADGRWRFMLYDTDFSSGLYEDDRTAVDRNSVNDVMANHPLFASAIESPEFCEMFMMSLKQIGENDLSPERVETTLDEWAEYWGGLMGDQYLRFGDYSLQWDRQLEAIKAFYRRRYDYIMAYAEETLGNQAN